MPFYRVNTNQQQLPSLNKLTNDIPPLLRDESEEIDADYEVIESSILIRSFPEWYAEQARQIMRELNFDLHLAVCEVEIKNGISASLEPIPQPELPPDMTIYNLNAILDS
ncbi:hypothetical protein [Anabaena sp. UHCC 0399]|uniref:hypothetical protein n=1 Tax=Anabaena sp. UHCC 0399 TaxID=3110238 RepID=UPI0016857F43|nr:hypothetical protein [Anabaena sp. UHCC 0399]MBD2361250.1 hypothetical protein [Anabaena minutissima FACHB-250]MEA5563874.1 hypothetical protein [Anabaena sp. UHCC 0399]